MTTPRKTAATKPAPAKTTTTKRITAAKKANPPARKTAAKPKLAAVGDLPECPRCGYAFPNPKRRGACSSKAACAKRQAEARS